MKKTEKKLVPRKHFVLIKPDGEKNRVSEYGIRTPDSVEQETKAFGYVISVGPEVDDIKKDDYVIYGKFSGEDVNFEEVDYVVVPEKEVFLFVK